MAKINEATDTDLKVLLFGVSPAHCTMLTKALNKVFATSEDEASPRYAEAIISDNNDLNATFEKWFKDINHKPFIAVSVDIMGTGVDIPCVRYISFAAMTKSVGKYVQMLGRGTRLDPKTGKFSFKVLDFVGLCIAMEDNGKGTPKENNEYEPSTDEIETIKDWAKKPEVYLDEGQIQKVYDFKQGSIWDFFLHALKIKKIPTPKERIKHGFDSYLKTYSFNDDQIHILQDIKDIFRRKHYSKKADHSTGDI